MLINESTNAMNLIALGNSTNKNNVSSKNENQASFANFLQPAKKDVSNSVNSTESDMKKDSRNDNLISGNSVSKNDENESVVSTKVDDSKKSDSVKNVDDYQNVEETVEDVADSVENVTETVVGIAPGNGLMDEDVEALQEVLSGVIQQITQMFDLTVVELGEELKDLSMEFSDLLTEDGVKQLFLDINSANISDLLVDENLNMEWNQLLAKFDEFQQGLELDEEMVPELDKMFDESVVTMSENVDEVEMIDDFDGVAKAKAEKVRTDDVKQSDSSRITSDAKQPEVVIVNQNDSSAKRNDTKDDGNDSGKENGSKEVVNSLANAIDQVGQVSLDDIISDNIETPVTGREIVNQVVEQIRVNMNQNTTSMEMQLYPEHLGKIQINVVSKDGVMTARIVAESETAKQAIESGLANLKESFEKQDLKVDAIEVMVSTAGFTDNNDNQSSYEQQRGSNSRRRMNMSGMEEEEAVDESGEDAKMEYSGSSVSYRA